MSDRTRTRIRNTRSSPSGQYDRWLGGNYWYGSKTAGRTWAKTQVTIDETHDWPRLKGETSRDVGGPFHTISARLTADWDLARLYTLGYGGSNGELYQGGVLPNMVPQNWDYVRTDFDREKLLFWADQHPAGYLEGLGSKAIASTIPTNPNMDAAVSIAELYREGLPSVVSSIDLRDRLGFFRGLGGDYLNIEFGWKPVLSDLLSLSQSILESEALLQQLARDSGRNVRRRLAFPADRQTTIGDDTIVPESGAPLSLLNQRGRSITTSSYHKTWFSGSYVYHYDPADLNEASRIATQARLLFGLQITPEVLWNLAPWSWLVDWFTNIGPILHNLSAFGQDGLVLRYGYLMHHHTRREDHLYRGVTLPKGGDFPAGDRRAAFCLESKRRIRATPYGFGLTFASFSVRQWAILAALGMTRAPGAL